MRMALFSGFDNSNRHVRIVYHGTTPEFPAVKGTPGGFKPVSLTQRGERTWQNSLPIDGKNHHVSTVRHMTQGLDMSRDFGTWFES